MEFSSLDINASALTAQRLRMDIISSNLANINTTRQTDGSVGAYRRKQVVFAPILHEAMSSTPIDKNGKYGPNSPDGLNLNPSVAGVEFNSAGIPLIKGGVSVNEGTPFQGVQVVDINEDNETPTRKVYDPGHPDADASGYVEMPNINVVSEMVDMISATRAYEANLTAISNYKTMFKATLQM